MRRVALTLAAIFVATGCSTEADETPSQGSTSSDSADTSPATTDVETPMTTTTGEGSSSSSDTGSSGAPESTGIATTGQTSGTTTGPGTTGSGSTTTGGEVGNSVRFQTTLGDIVLELDPVLAPVTAANFFSYVEEGFYDGEDGMGATIFHRVIPGFVIQGGGLTPRLSQKSTMPAIVNEFGNGLLNLRGTISMARTNDPNSATSQFFINLVDNDGLDDPPGYAVFGAVTEGLEVVDAIAAVETNDADVPLEPVIIMSATLE